MKLLTLIIAAIIFSVSTALAQTSDWRRVENALGRKGTIYQMDVFKATFPRTDLQVKVGDISVDTGLALTSWIGITGTQGNSVMMGDLVLLQGEVTPVIKNLMKEGFKITALHNHLMGTTPVVMYLHFTGQGDPQRLAEKIRAVLRNTATPMEVQNPIVSPQLPNDYWTRIEGIFKKKGQRNNNVLQLSFDRVETIAENGMVIPPSLGVATQIYFQSAGQKTAATGDFVLLADEVNRVVKALTDNGIVVTALHNHMLYESPRLFYLHFWGYETPERLARAIKAALDSTNIMK